MNKNAQVEREIPGWIIALILLVVIAGVIMLFFGPLKGYISQLSDDMSKTVTSCTLKAKLPDNGASFCKYVSVDFGAGTEYVNCVDSRVAAKLDSATAGKYSCANDYTSACKTVVISGGSNVTINGALVNCTEQVTCPNLNGLTATLKSGVNSVNAVKSGYTCSDSTKNRLVVVSVGVNAVAPNNIPYCCVDPSVV